MANSVEPPRNSFANALGGLVSLIVRDLGAAIAVAGGLWAGYATIAQAERSRDGSWAGYLVGGSIFVAIAVVCRWRGRV